MQYAVIQPGTSKRHLQRNRRLIPRVLRVMPMRRHIRRIRRHDQAILPSLDPRLVRAGRQCEVNEP